MKRSTQEVDDVLNWAVEGIESGTRYRGMSYEDGIDAALRWVMGYTDDRPDEE